MALSLSFQSLFSPLKPQPPRPHPTFGNPQAVVANEVLPGKRGRVKYQATYWFAITPMALSIQLKAGDKVRVLERRGNTLVVEPV